MSSVDNPAYANAYADAVDSAARTQAIKRGIMAASDSCFDALLPDDEFEDGADHDVLFVGGNEASEADGADQQQGERPGADFGLSLAPQPPARVLAAYAALQRAAAAGAAASTAGRPAHGARWTWPERAVVLSLGKLAKALIDAQHKTSFSSLYRSFFVPWVETHRAGVDAALAAFPQRSATALYSALKDIGRMQPGHFPPQWAHLRQQARDLVGSFWWM
jgi:hypothetical protein